MDSKVIPAAIAMSVALALLLSSIPAMGRGLATLPRERLDDPPGVPATLRGTGSSSISFGRFTSIQVNVAAGGANIIGDAANEPTIAVDPFDHDLMAIGWRQFDTIASNFREAGYAWSTDGGLTWTTGKIQPGVFRSDPVLAVDSDGDFFYLSLDDKLHSQIFASPDHGMTWGSPVKANGQDKPWMTIDRTAGPGRDHIYQAWSVEPFTTIPNFSRSIDGGVSFLDASNIPNAPSKGTLDVAADGTLYVVGTNSGITIVARSTDAQGGAGTPTFTTAAPDLGGSIIGGIPPNLEGLLGQLWIAVDRSTGPHAGWVYVLASVVTAADPLDVHFIRSTDGGVTWSVPVRVNDDPAGNGAYQWFGTMSVAPNGRIDAVWNDTRGSADSTISAIYYTFSTDGGATWWPNEQVSPTWNSMVGFPNQSKIGDYIHMVSDDTGADLAYAATFNGEQDVYYVRLAPALTAVRDVDRAPRLRPGLPNPFRAATTIGFDVPAGGARVRLDVLDCGGRQVATLVNGFHAGGANTAEWTGLGALGRPAAPGVYWCRYQAPGHVEVQKLVLLR